ncbi:MAG: FprA family A-type flavoprotein [Dehalococcoidia bacterium]|nr:MAG: FprA family A-type flavoprotein [Dehalococcoidia bacterium]
MLKIVVIYDSKYGNTKQVGEEIIAGIKDTMGTQAKMSKVRQINFDDIIAADAIFIGSPNHFGKATRSIKKCIDELGKINLNRIPVVVFDTYIGGDFEKTVKKMEKQLIEKVPALKVITPGLSIKVKGVRGPIPEEELSKCRQFGVKLAKPLKE